MMINTSLNVFSDSFVIYEVVSETNTSYFHLDNLFYLLEGSRSRCVTPALSEMDRTVCHFFMQTHHISWFLFHSLYGLSSSAKNNTLTAVFNY